MIFIIAAKIIEAINAVISHSKSISAIQSKVSIQKQFKGDQLNVGLYHIYNFQ